MGIVDIRGQRPIDRMQLTRTQNQLVLRGPSEPIAVLTTVPSVADPARVIRDLNWRYDCVDDFSAWSNLDKKTMGAMERAGSPLPAGQVTARQQLEFGGWDAKAQVFERRLLEPAHGRV